MRPARNGKVSEKVLRKATGLRTLLFKGESTTAELPNAAGTYARFKFIKYLL